MSHIKIIVKTLALAFMLLPSCFVFAAAISWVNKPINSGTLSDGAEKAVKISKNGRYIAFSSSSSNLVEGDVNLLTDLFIKDTQTNHISLVSRTTSGNQLSSSVGSFSRPTSDGTSIAFVSDDISLPMADGTKHLYTKNLQTQVVTALNYGPTPIRIAGSGVYLSDDGQYIYFNSDSDIVANDNNGKSDVYRMDINSGTFELISIATSGQAPSYSSYQLELVDVSEDGNYVLFAANSGEFHADATVASQVFGYIRDLQFNTTQIYTVNYLGDAENVTSPTGIGNSVVSNSGKVYFCSVQSNLVLNDTNGEEDLFKYANGVVSRLEFDTVVGEITDYGCRYFAAKNLSVAADDSYLLFPHRSEELHPDATGLIHLYQLNLTNNQLELISRNNNGVYSVSYFSEIDFTLDSETVVFLSRDAAITPGTYNDQSFSINTTNDALVKVAVANHQALVQNSTLNKSKMSDDQNHIIYTSSSTNASADSSNGTYINLYYYNRLTQTTTKIAEGLNGNPDVSPNGRYVAFPTYFFHPVTTILLDSTTVFLYDTQTGVYTQIAIGYEPAVNNEGNVVFESSDSTLVNNDNNGAADIFIFNSNSQSIDRVNVASNGDEAIGFSGGVSIAGEGLSTWIVFESSANNLIANDNNGSSRDIFIVNWPNGNLQRISEISGIGGSDSSLGAKISSDTSTVIFSTNADNLIGSATNAYQVMKYDRVLNSLQLISQSPSNSPSTESIYINQGVSSDGQYVAFSTAASLITGDSNGTSDIYLHDASSNALRIVASESEQPSVSDVTSDLSFSEPKLGILFKDYNALIGDLYGTYAVAGHNSGFLYQEGGDGETLSLEISGAGQVIGALGLNCQSDCTKVYTLGYELTLTAIVPSGQEFAAWQGECLQQNNASDLTCDVRMDESKTITAQFIDSDDRIFINGFED